MFNNARNIPDLRTQAQIVRDELAAALADGSLRITDVVTEPDVTIKALALTYLRGQVPVFTDPGRRGAWKAEYRPGESLPGTPASFLLASATGTPVVVKVGRNGDVHITAREYRRLLNLEMAPEIDRLATINTVEQGGTMLDAASAAAALQGYGYKVYPKRKLHGGAVRWAVFEVGGRFESSVMAELQCKGTKPGRAAGK